MFKKISFIAFLVLILLFIACSKNNDKFTYDKIIKIKDSSEIIKVKTINFINIESITEFEFFDKYLVLIDKYSDFMIKVYSLKTNKIVAEFGRKGQGPSEFISPSDIVKDNLNGDCFYIYDISTNLIKKFCFSKIIKNDFNPDRITLFKNSTIFEIKKIKNGFMGTGIIGKSRLAIFNESGEVIKKIGELPIREEKEVLISSHSHAFRSSFVILRKKNKVFMALRFASILEEYDLGKQSLTNVYGCPEIFFPNYDIVPVMQYYTMSRNKDTRFGFLDIDYNDENECLYLLYSGEKTFDNKGRATQGYRSNMIYVMNLKGEIIKKIKLDKDIITIKFDNSLSYIYGAASNGIVKIEYKE